LLPFVLRRFQSSRHRRYTKQSRLRSQFIIHRNNETNADDAGRPAGLLLRRSALHSAATTATASAVEATAAEQHCTKPHQWQTDRRSAGDTHPAAAYAPRRSTAVSHAKLS